MKGVYRYDESDRATGIQREIGRTAEADLCRGHPKYHESLKKQNKIFVRDRLRLLFDDGEYTEDGRFANCEAGICRRMASSRQWGK